MKYFVFILLISILVFTYFYYNRKLELLKKQLILTRNQYLSLINKYNPNRKSLNNINIRFNIPNYKGGTLKANSKLYLSPLLNSDILKETNSNIEVAILDCAEIDSKTCFYINIPSSNNINCRGWVDSKDISLFYSDSSSISKVNN
ncbi:hypothetical protein [uncultured Clostridium sp.]|uniref:hypothetical protein n=1 Tax=uncultured Clostridium sp. TaxID=59620 RepID=UPI00258DF471|nr:hypothetical protein [uncultured Clostridium sp.]